VHDTRRLPTARTRVPLLAPRAGFITDCDALELGLTAVALGAGRTRADQNVDPAVGIELAAVVGEKVERGQPLGWLHVRSKRGVEPLAARARAAFTIGNQRRRSRPLVLERIAR
jgi:pyrimidine-nucleoside phosphorylase